jgi:very-short-patch-repair endonuclease
MLSQIVERWGGLSDDLKRHGIETLRMLLQLGLSAYDDNEKRILSSAKILISRLEDPSLSEFVLADISSQLESAFEVLLGKIPLLAVTNLSTMRMFPSTDPAQFDLLVIDEASQCDVASTIPLLFRAKRVCVIGDPKQLKAVHQMKVSAHMHLKDKYNVQHQDFAPYDYLGFSFFDLANHWCLRERTSLLREHFRCHPRIAAYCNDVSYNNALRVLTDEGNLASTPMGRTGFHWSNVVGSCERVPQGGSICKEEVNEVIRIVREIADNEQNAFTLGVVAPFRAQANRIKDGLEKVLPTKVWDRLALLVETADGFQGDERDIIIFTVTCQPDIHRGSLWFVSQDKNRWNVAVSRARALLHIVGNLEFCSSSQVPHIRRLADHASGVKLTREEPFDSPPEKEFHEALKSAGIETVPQHPLAGYKLDLAVPNARLDIEVDGREFHLDQFGNRQSSDVWRDMTIESLGWKVLRFWVYELREDTEACVRQVCDHIAKHNNSNS